MNPEISLSAEQKVERIEVLIHESPEVAGLQAYEYFRNNGNDQKTEFIENDDYQLKPKYPDLSPQALHRVDQPMKVALSLLMAGPKSEKSVALYDSIEYRNSELFMVDMSRIMNDDESSESQRAEARDWFVLANENLYGKPDADVFSAIARGSLLRAIEYKESDDEDTRNLRDELASLFGSIDPTDFVPFKANDGLVANISKLVHERYDSLVEHIDPDKQYDTHGMVEMIQTALEKIQAVDLGWKSEIIPHSNGLSTAAHKKLLEVGANRTSIKGSNLRSRTIHEVGVHTSRSINASFAGWLSAEYGQDGYLDFEEAFATALEDAYKGAFKEHGRDFYLIAGLAYGLDNHEPRNFREVYEVMWRLKRLKNTVEGPQSEDIERKSKSSAFTATMRMFRGTDMQTPSVVYLKDLAHFNGQERAWAYLKDVKSQTDFAVAFAGKLDMTREDHLEIAEQIIASGKQIR